MTLSLSARGLAMLGFALWGVAVTVLSSALLGAHLLTLPTPPREAAQLGAGVASLAAPDDAWILVHALSSECRCSQAVLTHLLSSERPSSVAETILLVGPVGDLEAAIRAKGFGFESLTAEALDARYAIPAVPLLVVADPTRTVRYSGGYTARKQGPLLQDLEIVADLRGGGDVAALPLFGCAVNTALRDAVDPLGVR